MLALIIVKIRPPSTWRQKRILGFSLIELMACLALIAILLAVGIPTLQTSRDTTQARTAAESIKLGLTLAREKATARNNQVSFILTNNTDPDTTNPTAITTGRNWVIIAADDGSNQGFGRNIPSDNNVITVTGPSTLTFNSFGRVNNNNREYAVAIKGENAFKVQVSVAGKILLCNAHNTATTVACP